MLTTYSVYIITPHAHLYNRQIDKREQKVSELKLLQIHFHAVWRSIQLH